MGLAKGSSQSGNRGYDMRLKRKIAVLFVLIMAGMSSLAMAADLPVTSPFGWRVHPITGTWKFHTGVDLGYETGSGVPALLAMPERSISWAVSFLA